MRLVTLTVGIAIGVALSLAGVFWLGDPYEYTTAANRIEAIDTVNGGEGWHVAPNQSDPLHLRRFRLGHR